MSPNVHTMTSPVPLAGSASRWARIGTGTPNTGVIAVWPIRAAYRSSSGWATSATQAGSSSGRVVAMTTSEAAVANARRLNVPGVSRSSISACATAVPKVTSHSAGASAW